MVLLLLRTSGKMNWLQPNRKVTMAVAAIPGRAMGSTTLRKACIVDAPSMNAASSMARGNAIKTLYMIHMARGMKPEV